MIRRYTPLWYRLVLVVLILFIATTIAFAQSDSRPVITPDNAAQVTQIARLAFGETSKLALSPDGTVLALASDEGIWLYDAQDLSAPPRHMSGHVGEVNAIAFSADGELLASGGDDTTVRVWKVSEARQIRLFEQHEGAVLAVAFHPEGDQLASADNNGVIWFWANVGNLPIASVQPHETYAIHSLDYSPDGDILMSVDSEGIIYFHNTETMMNLGDFPHLGSRVDRIRQVAFNPAGEQIAVTGERGLILFELATGQYFTLDTVDEDVWVSAYSADGALIATQGQSKYVEIWDTVTGERVSVMEAEIDPKRYIPESLALSPDGTRLYAGYARGTFRVWDVPNETLLLAHYGFTQFFARVIFSPDGRYLAAENAGRIHVWDVDTLTEIARLQTERGETVIAFSHDGHWLASAGRVRASANPDERDQINEIHIWHTETWEIVATLTGHTGEVTALAFHPFEGRLLAAGTRVSDEETDHNIYLWNIQSGELLQTMVGHTDDVEGLTFTPNAMELLSASDDGTVRIWDYQNGEEVDQLTFEDLIPTGVAIAPDFSRVAVAFGEGAARWFTLNPVDPFEPPVGFVSVTASDISFNPDSTLLAFAGSDHELVLYDVVNGAVSAELPGHTSTVSDLAFSPDGTLVATAGNDGSLRLWAVAEEE